ncbi:MAG: hypothetical protein KKF48_00110 [Nanoarchaeota archaeon]|nr:hypothetical protein [Nanoarchaeota archaeon]MBU1027427.1 hypothetical protein [Nanoarchaeota archaeon]
MKIKEIKKFGRKKIIKIAAEKIREECLKKNIKGFNIKNFTKIKVKMSDKTVCVKFGMPVIFVQNKSKKNFVYNVDVIISEKFEYVNFFGQFPGNIEVKNKRFFIPTPKIKKAIEFVLKMAKKGEVGTSNGKRFGINTTTTIEDLNNTYKVNEFHHPINEGMVCEYNSYYEISKKTGKILRNFHSDPCPYPLLKVTGTKTEIFKEINN